MSVVSYDFEVLGEFGQLLGEALCASEAVMQKYERLTTPLGLVIEVASSYVHVRQDASSEGVVILEMAWISVYLAWANRRLSWQKVEVSPWGRFARV